MSIPGRLWSDPRMPISIPMALPHSDMTKLLLWLTNSGKPAAVRTARRNKIGLMPRRSCDPAHTAVERKEEKKMMKPSTNDQIEGALHEVKGKVKEVAGQVAGNPDLEAEGQGEKIVGKVQKKVGQIEKVFEG
jgi:uncharacterized protein YjbJ (UPF0337 family)